MSYLQEKLDVEEYFKANWTHTSIYYENDEVSTASEWVRISIQNADAYQASLGDDPLFRFVGVVFVQIFTGTDQGSGRALQLADKVDELFRRLVYKNLRFKTPQVRRVPNNSEWYQVNVSTEFYRGSC